MSSARWRPSKGSYGFFTSEGSQVGKLRRYLDEHGEGKRGVMPGTMPAGNIAEVSGQPIPGLGSRPLYQRQGKRMNPTSFEEAWYKPMRQFSVGDVYDEWAGIDTEGGKFTYATPQQTEEDILPKEGDVGMLLEQAELAKTTAEEEYTTAIEGLDIEEQESRGEFGVGQKDIAQARKEAARGAETEYEAADIQAAQTGMAYSAPAEEAYELEQTEGTMASIAAGEEKLRTGHLKTLRDIEGKRGEAEVTWEGAQEQYDLDIYNAYSAATDALDNILEDLETVYSQHRDTGGFETGLRGIKGMFQEAKTELPGYSGVESRYEKARTYAEGKKG